MVPHHFSRAKEIGEDGFCAGVLRGTSGTLAFEPNKGIFGIHRSNDALIDLVSEPHRSRPSEEWKWYDEDRMQYYDRDNKPFFVLPPPDTQYQAARNMAGLVLSEQWFRSRHSDSSYRGPTDDKCERITSPADRQTPAQIQLTPNPFSRRILQTRIQVLLGNRSGKRVKLDIFYAFRILHHCVSKLCWNARKRKFRCKRDLLLLLRSQFAKFLKLASSALFVSGKILSLCQSLARLFLPFAKDACKQALRYPTGCRRDQQLAKLVLLLHGPNWRSSIASILQTALIQDLQHVMQEGTTTEFNHSSSTSQTLFVQKVDPTPSPPSCRAIMSGQPHYQAAASFSYGLLDPRSLALIDYRGGGTWSINFHWKPPLFDLKLLRYREGASPEYQCGKVAGIPSGISGLRWMLLPGSMYKGYIVQRDGSVPVPLDRQTVRNRSASVLEQQIREVNSGIGMEQWVFAPKSFNSIFLRSLRKVRLAPSGIHGFGIFVDDWVPEGAVIMEYVGESYIHEADYRDFNLSDIREQRYEWEHGHCYNFSVHCGWHEKYIDGTDTGNLTRFVNHCCEPNCESVLMDLADGSNICVAIVALRDICPGEELFYDYHFSDKSKERCLCRAPTCTGTM